ncbi:hypothetical protein DXG01_016006 [Tephrocybe rancida]|nr:hypothetical protein DXG01_016006 [Tephrocybe rancida]
MYSDDDLQDEKSALFTVWDSPPFLCVYGESEERMREAYVSCIQDTLPLGETLDSTDLGDLSEAINALRMWRVRAFFKIVQGFYTRFEEVHAIWHAYIVSFLKLTDRVSLSQKVVGSDSEEDGFDSDNGLVTEYVFDDGDVWKRFREEWKVPPEISYESLLEYTRKTLNVIATASCVHQIQKTQLLDLPPEVLDAIFTQADEDQARLLSSTCRALNEIGHRHLVIHRRIILKQTVSFWSRMDVSGLPADEYIEREALAARENVLALCEHLESRADLLDKLERLWIADEWTDLEDLAPSNLRDGHFHVPLFRSLGRIMGCSTNLTSIGFCLMKLPLSVVSAICLLPNLAHLRLISCGISKEAQRALLLDYRGALSSAVRSLNITTTTDTSPWFALLFCPKLRSLSAQAIEDSMHPPPQWIWDKCRFFDTLKYLYLAKLLSPHISTFTEFIERASHDSAPKLTHVKITGHLPMTDAAILDFLDVLHGVSAPLEVLSIGGALQAEPALFAQIARWFPDLMGLTVARRDSTRQTLDHRFAVWPVPAWQYAEHFSGFSRLQYFGWNNFSFSCSFSTFSLRFLEDGWPETNDYAGRKEERRCALFDPSELGRWAPVMFGIRCATLRTFNASVLTYRIERMEGGGVRADSGSPSEETGKWNPSPLGSWSMTEVADE